MLFLRKTAISSGRNNSFIAPIDLKNFILAYLYLKSTFSWDLLEMLTLT